MYTVNGSVLLADDSGGSGSGTRDVELTRVLDDSNNEIGTWYMNFVDGSNNEYKVVILDAQYRLDSSKWLSGNRTVTGMPTYDNSVSSWWYNATETATENTQTILDYCTATGYTSTACSHCRSKSFVISGTTYYGQLISMREFFDMWRRRAQIEAMDTTASTYTSVNFSGARNLWSSTQNDYTNAWYFNSSGRVYINSKSSDYQACPVLEIPVA